VRAPEFAPLDQNAVIVRVISYDQKNLRGVLASPKLEKPTPFCSLTQLLLTMEELMDQSNQPQRGEERRSFSAARAVGVRPQDLEDAPQKLATFQLRILFRQNASWQGSLIWVDKRMDAQFRSVLELIWLMDSALTSQEECGTQI